MNNFDEKQLVVVLMGKKKLGILFKIKKVA